MNRQFELKLLLKQNSEMISKMQWYRRENQQLIQRNHDLNLWVQNLSQVFAAIGASWKTITNNQQALFNLMKKRSDANSKSLISKYISHFRTFDEIINNLGQKITNSGHSNEATLDAKERLNAFVQNYQLFFKQIVDSYFKFNEQYLQWMNQLKNKPELPQTFRILSNKQIQNRLKIKQFQNFMNEFRGKFKNYQSQNQHKLLDGILNIKNQQINSLNLLNQKQSRTINLMLNYSTNNTQLILQGNQKDYQCYCGGMQLQYFKKQWESYLQQLKNQGEKQKNIKNQPECPSFMNQQDYDLLELQKQKLIERITNLQGKIEKIKIQNRLTEELVIGSSAYQVLHHQAQQLVDYVNDLLHKITTHYNFLYEIEKAREDEILELKQKLQKAETPPSLSRIASESPKIQVQNNLIEFNTNITNLIKDLTTQFNDISSKIVQKDQVLVKSKEYVAVLKKQNEDLIKKIQFLEANKNAPLQFRHEKFNEVEKKVSQVLSSFVKQDTNKQNVIALWKQFIEYVKSRDKKIRDLESIIKKKEKEIGQKDKTLAVLQSSLKETQSMYLTAQNQLKKFDEFVDSTQKQLKVLAEKNITLRTQFQVQKNLLNYKNKTEIGSKQKMQQRIRHYEAMQQQINEVRKMTQQVEQNYDNWIKEQEEKFMNAELMIEEKNTQLNLKNNQLNEKQKLIIKLIEEKEKVKSEFVKLGARMNAIEEKSEIGVVKMELQEYKRKLMCSCSREQQRSVVLTTCPHAFCKRCIEDMNISRNRKCPLCGIKFGKTDIHDIILS